MNSIQSNSFTGLLSMVLFIAIYVTTCVALVQRAFSMIHLIPEKVPAWIGGASRSADPSGELNAAKGGISGSSGAMTQAGSAGMGSAGKGVQKARDNKKKKDDLDAAKKAANEKASAGNDKIHSSAKGDR